MSCAIPSGASGVRSPRPCGHRMKMHAKTHLKKYSTIQLDELFFSSEPLLCNQRELKPITSCKMLQLVTPSSSWTSGASTMAHVRPPLYSLTRPSAISSTCQGASKAPLPPSMRDNPIFHTVPRCNANYSIQTLPGRPRDLFFTIPC